jgi:hypothetical protein
MITVLLRASGLLWLAAAMLHAQGPLEPMTGLVPKGPTIGDAQLRRECPSFVERAEPPVGSGFDTIPNKTSCRVASVATLPDADGTRWRAANYERQLDYPAGPVEPAHTATLHSAALYSATNDAAGWHAVWWLEVDHEYTRSITPQLGRRPDGSAFVAVSYCWNGTGGCYQQFMRRSGGRWRAVADAYRSGIPLPQQTYIGKGRGVDVSTLRGSFGLYEQSDGNCCPSRELVVELNLRNDSLVLRRFQIRKTEE